MLNDYFTEKLLGLQGVIVTNVKEGDTTTTVFAEMERKEHHCVCCGTATDTIHDYRLQTIKDIPAFGKTVRIVLRKRRYRCPNCGKRFFEDNGFLPRYYRTTNRLTAFILDKLRDERSFTSVAKEVDLSVSTVIRRFDLVSYGKPSLSSALSIDEFKGNTSGEKYQCIVTDPEKKTVLDILPKRYGYYLTSYFNSFPRSQRDHVNVFVSDMWKPYADTADVWFKNATQVIDRFHWTRQAIWAFENVRKQEQKKLGPELRKYFKRSKSLLIKRQDELTPEQEQEVNVMLYYSVSIVAIDVLLNRRSFVQSADASVRGSASVFLNTLKSSPAPTTSRTKTNWNRIPTISSADGFTRLFFSALTVYRTSGIPASTMNA